MGYEAQPCTTIPPRPASFCPPGSYTRCLPFLCHPATGFQNSQAGAEPRLLGLRPHRAFWVGPGSFRQRLHQVLRENRCPGDIWDLSSIVALRQGLPVAGRGPLFPNKRGPYRHRGGVKTQPKKMLFTPRGDYVESSWLWLWQAIRPQG